MEAFEQVRVDYLRSLGSLVIARYGFGVFDFLAGLEQSGRNAFADAFVAMGMPEALAAKMQFYPLVLKAELSADKRSSYFFKLIVKDAEANREVDSAMVERGNELLHAANAERHAAFVQGAAQEIAATQERHPSTSNVSSVSGGGQSPSLDFSDGVIGAESSVEFKTPFSGTVIAHSDEEASAAFKAEYAERTGLPVDAIKVVIMADDGQISGDTDAVSEMGLSLDEILKRFA